ncbi:hypothetical protein V866_005159 [Kwoniella sp. B9012]|uniref:Inositol phosphatase domain-containing protein n=1 Tax=Kwoniella europaea PYCC6329 TaxID=1423913 RepID=A0AAX4KMQ3_9TREE
MFYGAVSDFFAQAVISFLLGHRNLSVFSEFLQTLNSTDAASVVKLSRIRSVASLEEKVLLLTREAIYVVSFNYSLEKVMEFTRIPLKSITSIQKGMSLFIKVYADISGAYILSTLQEASRDPKENYGFLVNFSPTNESTRYSTYSLRNKLPSVPQDSTPTPGTPKPSVKHALIDPDVTEFYAFKAIPGHTSDEGTCQESVNNAVKQIAEVCKDEELIVEKDIVSLAEAESATSILDKMDYAFKRFLWL